MNLSITGKKCPTTQYDKNLTPIMTKPKAKDQNQLGPKIQPKQITYLKKNQPKQKIQIKKQKSGNGQKQIISSLKSTNETKKIQQKIYDVPKLQQKNQPKIIVQEVVVQPPRILELIVRYNHYKDAFPVQNQILRFSTIQEKYGFNLVFKGNYLPILKEYRKPDQIQPLTEGTAIDYSWKVYQGKQYQIYIQEDEQEQSKYQKKAYKAPQASQKPNCKKNVRVEMLTAEMKKLQIQQLGSQKHKQLLEQRDLQQILFS